MNEYTKQHFIPKWYLQYFSLDYDKLRKDGHIWIYDIKSKKIEITTVQNTAQKKHFYDYDGKFETLILNPVECKTANVIHKIVVNKNIADFSKSSYETILKFLLLQTHRTDTSKKIVKRFYEKYSYEKYPQLRKIKNSKEFDALFFQYFIKMVLADTCNIFDLRLFLAINSTAIPFITSDYPVVLNNYFYANLSIHGFQTPGLQIICPISDKICLFLVHEELYNVQSDKSSKIEIHQSSDIDLINCLQILNCHKHIFFSGKNNLTNIRRSDKKALQIKRESNQLQRKRPYDDKKDRIYSINFSFLSAKRGIDMFQFEKKFGNATLPIRDKNLYGNAFSKGESVIAEFGTDLRLLLEREDLLKKPKQ